jgi:hypothetical protein
MRDRVESQSKTTTSKGGAPWVRRDIGPGS